MQKDNEPSKKYTEQKQKLFRDEFTTLDIPYKYRDYCQDDYADYLSCVRVHPRVLTNNLIYMLPFSEYYSFCKPLFNQWEKCQRYREKELLGKLNTILQERRNMD